MSNEELSLEAILLRLISNVSKNNELLYNLRCEVADKFNRLVNLIVDDKELKKDLEISLEKQDGRINNEFK